MDERITTRQANKTNKHQTYKLRLGRSIGWGGPLRNCCCCCFRYCCICTWLGCNNRNIKIVRAWLSRLMGVLCPKPHHGGLGRTIGSPSFLSTSVSVRPWPGFDTWVTGSPTTGPLVVDILNGSMVDLRDFSLQKCFGPTPLKIR